MPVIFITSPNESPSQDALYGLCGKVAALLAIPTEHVWSIWQHVGSSYARRDWDGGGMPGPIVTVKCRSIYNKQQIAQMLLVIRDELVKITGAHEESVLIGVDRFEPGELHVRGQTWVESPQPADDILVKPLGWVSSPRRTMEDDEWGEVVSTINLSPTIVSTESIRGLQDFSHLEIVFFMHQVSVAEVEVGARHPRNSSELPLVGILAQRAKRRPNRLGVSRCELISVTGMELVVRGLDAIDGSPVIDIKPYFAEFGPRGPVAQPSWVASIMRNYY